MNLSGPGASQSELSSHQIRAITARLAHPNDALTGWRLEFDEWRRAYSEFQEMQRDRFLAAEPATELMAREHRYVLFLLLGRGEELGLLLINSQYANHLERTTLLDQLDAFLGSLRDSWQTWHGEALPESRGWSPKFLS